jgi:hypothetical protein
MKLGAQFYSIRDNTTTPEALYEAFKAIKDIGYEAVQMSAICDIDATLLKSYSDELALPITCTHSPFERIVNDTDNLIKEHLIYRCPTIGLGYMPNEYHEGRGVYDFIEILREPIRKIKAAGLNFAYHNHAFEFKSVEGKLMFDILIDELPELVNILKGDMSIVGPRPLLVKYLPLYTAEQMRRHEVRPGITGYAQANGRNAISWEKKFEYDVEYVDNVSFALDVKILFRTVFSVLRREGIDSGSSVTMEEFTGTPSAVSADDTVNEENYV